MISRINILSLIVIYIYAPLAVNLNIPYPTQGGQLFFLINSSLVLFGIFAFNLILRPKNLNFRIIDLLLLILGVYVAIYFLYSFEFNPPIGFYGLMSLASIYIFIRNINTSNIHLLFFSVILGGLFEAVYGNLQLLNLLSTYNPYFKLTGTFFNPGPFAGYLASVFPIAFGSYFLLFPIDNNELLIKIMRWVSLVCVITILIVLPASGSRAAWISVAVSTLFLLNNKYNIYSKAKIKLLSREKLIILSICVLIVLSCSIFCLYRLKPSSVDGRFLIWKITLQMISNKPLLGYGPEGFKANYMDYQSDYFGVDRPQNEIRIADNVEYAFNDFLQILSEFGIVGFAIVIILLSICMRQRTRKEDRRLLILKSALLSMIIYSLLTYTVGVWPILLNGTLYLALVSKYSATIKYSIFTNKKIMCGIGRVFVAVPLFISSITLWYIFEDQKKSYYAWKEGLDWYYKEHYFLSLSEYRKGYDDLKTNGIFLSNYGKALNSAKKYKEAKFILNKSLVYYGNSITYITLGDTYEELGEYKYAIACYRKAANMTPSHFYPIYLLAKIYFISDQKEQALFYARTLLNMKIKVPSLAISEMKNEMTLLIKKINTK